MSETNDEVKAGQATAPTAPAEGQTATGPAPEATADTQAEAPSGENTEVVEEEEAA